tara:strand:- start:6235 stop:6624 length:390 start_codon:yes stop_codon:yes gene_type:complete
MKKLLAILVILFAAAGCTQTQEETPQQTEFYVQATTLDGEILFKHPVSSLAGSNVLDALLENGEDLQYETASFGAFVTGIGTLVPEENQYIAMYVDGEYASVGVSDLIIEEGMLLEFRIEAIDSAQILE